MRFAFSFLFLLFVIQPSQAQNINSTRNYSDVGICADLHKLKEKSKTGFEDKRGDILAKGLSPYDSARSGFTKTRYETEKILHNATSCEIWAPDNPQAYNHTRYACHWDAEYATQRKEKFESIMDAIGTCFGYGEFTCATVYEDRQVCFLKNSKPYGTMIEWGEGISKDEHGTPKFFAYFYIYDQAKPKVKE